MSFLRSYLKRHWAQRSRPVTKQPSRRWARLMAFEVLEEKVVLSTFAVIGDFGKSGPGASAVANLVNSWNPDAIVTLGDNNEDGSAENIDPNIGQYYHQYIGNYQGAYGQGSLTNRFFPVLGNHDWEAPGAQPYLDYFSLPGNERYYDFVLDNVHFFALDSDPHEPDGIDSGSVQAQWLQNALADSQAAFKIVYFHHAPYTSNAGVGPTLAMRWPFRQWGADAVMAGHAHQYERLHVDGLPYFVNGLGGDEIVDFSYPAEGSQLRYNDNFGAMRLTTSSTQLRFEFLSIDGAGTLVDSLTLTANGADNDDFGNATLLSGTSSHAIGTNIGATFETGEPYNIGTTGGTSVWWNWTAPAAGSVTIGTAGSNFDTTLGVYTGGSVHSLAKVASNDDASGSVLTSRVTFAAAAGTTYRISVDGYQAAIGHIELELTLTPAPVNDAFGSALVLTGHEVSASGSNTSATKQTGEPSNAGVAGGKSVWWSWTPSTSGTVTVSTAGSSFDTTLAVYTGASVDALSVVASNDDQSGSVLTSRVQFAAVAGQTYRISVDGYQGAHGAIALSVILSAPPVNDNFTNRIVLSGAAETVGSNLGATREAGEPNHSAGAGGRSVWWSWTAPTSGTVTISTAGSGFDTTLGVYTGSALGALYNVASNDDESGSRLTSRVQFAAVAGQAYHIAVDGYGLSAGNIALSVALTAPPINDGFANRTQLSGSTLVVQSTNLAATTEPGEPRNANVTGGRSVWWSWSTTVSGTVTISTAGSSFDTTLGIYSGSAIGNLVSVASNDDAGGSTLTSRVQFTAIAGLTYHISVDGYRGAMGDISLAIDLLPGLAP